MVGELEQLAREAAERHKLPPALVCAMIEVESAWDPWATRYEPAFFTRYIDKSAIHRVVREFCHSAKFYISFETELHERATSRGLFQMLGQVARERGYVGPIAKLHEPATACELGCGHFRWLLDRNAGDVSRALLRWNGGSDAQYPTRVLGRVAKYTNET